MCVSKIALVVTGVLVGGTGVSVAVGVFVGGMGVCCRNGNVQLTYPHVGGHVGVDDTHKNCCVFAEEFTVNPLSGWTGVKFAPLPVSLVTYITCGDCDLFIALAVTTFPSSSIVKLAKGQVG
ncbi:MAG TPA: hypothetical protein VMR41_05525 [Patescibacteria group bacterium]|nr:hypothetical protein [Patescibacteria group bacterium]